MEGRQEVSNRPETEIPKQAPQLVFCSPEAKIVRKPVLGVGLEAWLIGIQFPWVYIDNSRVALFVDLSYSTVGKGIGVETKITSPGNGPVFTEYSDCRSRYLD